MTEHESTDPGLEVLRKQYDSICRRDRIGWHAERQFLGTLGVGGQGVVFLSERRGSAEFKLPLALKIFSPSKYESTEDYQFEMRRLTRVASRVALVQQDQLVTVQNVINHCDLYLMEMEWIDGYDLQRLLRRDALAHTRDHVTERRWRTINDRIVTPGAEDSRLKPGTAVSVLRECLSGLASLHRNGIIHCDVKPSNIMLKRTGSVKLIDIGSAFVTDDPPLGQPCTPEYAAPEVLRGEMATPQSDLASLGYVLIEMLTGSHPFNGLSYSQLLQAKMDIGPRLPAILPVEEFALAEPLILLLRRLITPDPTQRFASAEEAELGAGGASEFLRELVKSDLPDHYTNELRQWISDIDPVGVPTHALEPSSDEIPGGTTRLLQ